MSRLRFNFLLITFGLIATLISSSNSIIHAEEPLHVRIDQLIGQTTVSPTAEIVGDHEFLRRVSIDLTGMPPFIDELKSFLANESPRKREALVDRLLSEPEYVRHLTTSLDIMLMERRVNQHVKQEEWLDWLHSSVSQKQAVERTGQGDSFLRWRQLGTASPRSILPRPWE